MSRSESSNSHNLLTEKESEYEPFPQQALDHHQEDADLHPEELSGDENGEQSVLVSVAGSSKASSSPSMQT